MSTTTTTTDRTTTREENYRRALKASRDIRALDNMVRLIAELGPPRDAEQPMCYACIWDSALKPLTNHVVGWCRGTRVDPEPDPGAALESFYADVSALLDAEPCNEATSETRAVAALRGGVERRHPHLDKAPRRCRPALGHGLPARKEKNR